jgi:hypothetical protein
MSFLFPICHLARRASELRLTDGNFSVRLRLGRFLDALLHDRSSDLAVVASVK